MAVDITKLKEGILLSTLGDDEWVIVMPEGYAELRLSTQWRDELAAWAATRFVRWVLEHTRFEIDYDNDPPWDRSGEAKRRTADPLMLRTLYTTLDEWLENEYTGQWTPSYESGYGKYWETYSGLLTHYIMERLTDLFRIQYADQIAADPDFEDVMWEDVSLVSITLEQALMMSIVRITTAEAWQRFEALTYQKIAEEQHQQAELEARYARMRTYTHAIWKTYFGDLHGMKIEQPQFKALNVEQRLRQCLLDADPEAVAAMTQIGLPGVFSNSVRKQIKAIARHALG